MTYTETRQPIIPGYRIIEVEDPYQNWELTTYNVFDSLTEDYLFQIFQTTEGWKIHFTRKTYETVEQAVAVSREKLIERVERSIKMEVRTITGFEPDGFGSAYIVRNKESGNHYVVRPEHPDANSRCECPDALYRGGVCKHQLAVAESLEPETSWKRKASETLERVTEGEELAIDTANGEAVLSYETDTRFGVNYLCTRRSGSAGTKLIMSLEGLEKYIFDLYNPRVIEAFGDANPRFSSPYSLPPLTITSPDGFYDWEVADNFGELVANIYYCSDNLTQPYAVFVDGILIHQTNAQAKAESYVIWHYKNGTLASATEQPEEIEVSDPCGIEDCDYLEERGQQYIFRINNKIAGYIWFYDDGNWENHEEFWQNGDGNKYSDWLECGLALAKRTEKILYLEYQALKVA